MLGAALIQKLMGDQDAAQPVREMLAERYREADTSTTDFLAHDIRVCKWHVFREGTAGGLELKLAPDLATVERELTRVITSKGGQQFASLAPRGPRVRALDRALEGTWRTGRDGEHGGNSASSAGDGGRRNGGVLAGGAGRGAGGVGGAEGAEHTAAGRRGSSLCWRGWRLIRGKQHGRDHTGWHRCRRCGCRSTRGKTPGSPAGGLAWPAGWRAVVVTGAATGAAAAAVDGAASDGSVVAVSAEAREGEDGGDGASVGMGGERRRGTRGGCGGGRGGKVGRRERDGRPTARGAAAAAGRTGRPDHGGVQAGKGRTGT